MKRLLETDYRWSIPRIDQYGRRMCDRCQKRRKVNAYWKDRDTVLCKECSVAKDVAIAYSLRHTL